MPAKVAALILLVTVKLDKVPSCVIFACVPDDKAPLNVPPCIVPLTDNPVKVPKLVSEEAVTLLASVVPVNNPASADVVMVMSDVPSNETPLIFLAVASFVAVAALPVMAPLIGVVTVSPDNVPTKVIFGCAAVVSVPPSVDAVMPPEATTEVGVIAPRLNEIEGVVVGLNTVADTPLAAVTETLVTPVAGTLPART